MSIFNSPLLGKRYRQASFRGAKFFVENADYDVGRRTVDHEYPNRDKPYSEDLGRKAQEYSLEVYVLGKNYRQDRDAIIDACQTAGPGDLQHPYLGLKKVVCKSCRVRENSREAGFARISLSFREAGELLFPDVSRDPTSSMLGSIASAIAEINNQFAAGFDILSTPGYVVDAAIDQVSNAADLVNQAASGIKTATKDITALAFKIRQLKAGLRDIAKVPGDLSKRLSDSIGLLSQAVSGGNRKEVRGALIAILPFGSTYIPVNKTTPSRTKQANNQTALVNFIRQTAAVNAASEAVNSTFDTAEEAVATRDTITAALDAQMDAAASDSLYSALQDVRAKMVAAVPGVADLPHLISVVPDQTISSITLAYDLYESLDKESTILNQNRIRHPGFIQGGREIQVPVVAQ